MPGSFFDSNIVLYGASGKEAKADGAEQLLRTGGTISVQVLNETANVARRKMALSWPQVRFFLSTIRDLVEVTPLTVGTHELGLALAERYGLSTYDAMLQPRRWKLAAMCCGRRTCKTGW